MSEIGAQLLSAHEARDAAALVTLYTLAADQAGSHDETVAGFFLTHAYVYALETGDARAGSLRARLVAAGREAPEA